MRLGPLRSPQHVIGWTIQVADPDTIELTADGPLMSALIVGRRTSPSAVRIETFVTYRERPTAE